MELIWTCHICGQVRPCDKIGIFSRDTSADYDLPAGTIQQNVRYCNDNDVCRERAITFSFTKKRGKELS